MLRAYNSGLLPHFFPHLNRCRVHVKQPHLLASLSSLAVDADFGEELSRGALQQIRPHADGRRVFYILYFLRILDNNPVVPRRRVAIRCEAFQRIA